MEEDYGYIEDDEKKSKLHFIIIIIFLMAGATYIFFQVKNNTLQLKTITYEIGDQLNYGISFYMKNEIVDENDYNINLSGVKNTNGILDQVGKYEYTIKYKNVTKTGTIKVVDTKPPMVEVTNLKIVLNDEYIPDDFLLLCDDYSKPCDVSFKNASDANLSKKIGTYNIDLVIKDNYGNQIIKSVKLEVTKDVSNNVKVDDLTYATTYPLYKDFNGNMIKKFKKAVLEDDPIQENAYGEVLDILSSDLHEYLDATYQNNEIIDSEMLYVYNQYGFIIGYAIRVTLDNNMIIYIK